MLRRGPRQATDPRRATFLGLSIPTALALLVFLVAPIALTVSMSFHEELTKDVLGPFDPTLEHYQRATSVASYWQLLWTSGVMAFIVALSRRSSRTRSRTSSPSAPAPARACT